MKASPGPNFDAVLGPASAGINERLLHDAALRAARLPKGRLASGHLATARMAIVLHLSGLPAPAPRPHHRRIARACMQDTASRHEGQVFTMGSGDIVLLCNSPTPQLSSLNNAPRPAAKTAIVADPEALPDILARLLRADTPPQMRLVSVWMLDSQSAELLHYAASCLGDPPAPTAIDEDFAAQTSTVDAIGAVVGTAEITDLMQRQAAVLLGPTEKAGQAGGLVPLYREVTFSIAALEARIKAHGHAGDDPFLFRHLATRLDQRMLETLQQQLGSGSPLDVTATGHKHATAASVPAAIHLNLTVNGVLSPAFSRFATACAGMAIGIEISLLEAIADAEAFAQARAAVARAGFALVLDGVSHLSLTLCRPGALGPDLLKLDWSPRLTTLSETETNRIARALIEIGPQRIVLHRAETEAALRWGLQHGIRRFQGRHVDAMLGAARITACPKAAFCTLRQCIERAGATGAPGRAGCTNIALLDTDATPSSLFTPQPRRANHATGTQHRVEPA
jgi:EAL domain-containing protein (putative c-di-GMP-specific phosphodiesterase class I)